MGKFDWGLKRMLAPQGLTSSPTNSTPGALRLPDALIDTLEAPLRRTVVHCATIGLSSLLSRAMALWTMCASPQHVADTFVALAATVRADVANVWIAHPPFNALTAHQDLGIAEALDMALAAVVRGAGGIAAVHVLLRVGANPCGIVPARYVGLSCVGKTVTPLHAAVAYQRLPELSTMLKTAVQRATTQAARSQLAALVNEPQASGVSLVELAALYGRSQCRDILRTETVMPALEVECDAIEHKTD
jgi:hypothetical protein